MKVLFILRSTFETTLGGDSIQALSTAKFLRMRGVEVDVLHAHQNPDYSQYDIMHFFNIIRPDDILRHINQTNIPIAISTIFVDYGYYKNAGNHPAYPFLFKLFSADHIEYLKRIARSIKNGEIFPSSKYLLKGHRKSVVEILNRSNVLLPNSSSELKRLCEYYPVNTQAEIIPNGIDKTIFNRKVNHQFRIPNKVIIVGRIEVRKNQLNLIRALNGTEFRLHIIGKAAPNHINYLNQCIKEAGPNIKFHHHVSETELLEHYETAAIHAMPSRFETTGLSSLEAAFMGCALVISDKGDTKEYFENMAEYADPENPSDILAKVRKASANGFNSNLYNKIQDNYTWEIAAEKTLQAYEKILQ